MVDYFNNHCYGSYPVAIFLSCYNERLTKS